MQLVRTNCICICAYYLRLISTDWLIEYMYTCFKNILSHALIRNVNRAPNTNFIFVSQTRSVLEPTIYHEAVSTTDAVSLFWIEVEEPDYHNSEYIILCNSTFYFQLQGSLIFAGTVHMLIGLTGLIGILLRYLGPITVIPTLLLLGIEFYHVVTKLCEAQWAVSIA